MELHSVGWEQGLDGVVVLCCEVKKQWELGPLCEIRVQRHLGLLCDVR